MIKDVPEFNPEKQEKYPYALISYYIASYKQKYSRQPVVNRYREKWAMKDVIDTVGFTRAKEIMDYYFGLDRSNHPLDWFYNNFDKMDVSMKKSAADKARREVILSRTRIMVEERKNEH
jgi:hypothetical protein